MGHKIAFGIDVGGSGIKGAPVDLETGELIADRVRIPTPKPSTPEAVVEVFKQIIGSFDLAENVPVGIAFPAPIDHGVVRFIANLDQSWTGVNLLELVEKATGHKVTVVNDADAAGFAEQRYGAARSKQGSVLVVTLGTGIGTSLIVDGVLVPNTELGHLEIAGYDAEYLAADSAREREALTFPQWAERLQKYFDTVEMLLSPDLIVVGGGVSKKYKEFLPLLQLRAPIIPAKLFNTAGIAGAAAYAEAERKRLKAAKHVDKKHH